MKKIILASGSPRRKEILSNLVGNSFDTAKSNYKEDNSLNLAPEKLVMKHSSMKAKDVAENHSNCIIIAADSLVVLDGNVLGKPKTESRAREMLKSLSGKTVKVITGVSIIDSEKSLTITDFESTTVFFKSMNDEEIDLYIKSKEPLDKAGAFGIQGLGGIFIERINGCYFNVMGFPVFKINKMLNSIGINILKDYN